MIACLISLIIAVIVAVIVIWILETAVNSIIKVPPPIWTLVRLLIGLIVLLYALECLGLFDTGFHFHVRRY